MSTLSNLLKSLGLGTPLEVSKDLGESYQNLTNWYGSKDKPRNRHRRLKLMLIGLKAEQRQEQGLDPQHPETKEFKKHLECGK